MSALHPQISEAAFQSRVIQWATLNGWLVYHTFDSRRSVEGFPDLVLVKDTVVYLELKAEKGRVSPAQEKWVHRLHQAGQEVRIVRPSDWPWIVERFGRRRAA